MLFEDERATKAVLSFLRGTKLGQMVTIRLGAERKRKKEREKTPREREGRWKG